jgi:cardiolipin synthase
MQSTPTILAMALLAAAAAMAASLHAILYKRDVRAAIGWAGFIWIAPFVGPLLYLLFGVNRIRRRGALLRGHTKWSRVSSESQWLSDRRFDKLVRFGDSVSRYPLRAGNRIVPFDGGERVYPVMLEAIDGARRTVALSTYILEDDHAGRQFGDALIRADERGVEVRVLLDAVGSRTGGHRILHNLNRGRIRSGIFLPAFAARGFLNTNLRNHRKLLVVDGETAFTGGMNISDEYRLGAEDRRVIDDTHFLVEGPVVADLQQTFVEDWSFASSEDLSGAGWFPALEACGGADARVFADGPDEDFERIRWIILGAVATARSTIRIVTPYFLPDNALITALNVAALRGVRVEILIPERLDHAVVKWASNAMLWQVLERGCRVWFTPPPFDHSKLFTVDGTWTLFGSSNWDPRSFRLNFELNVETFNPALVEVIDTMISRKRETAREITLAMVDARSFPIRVRDGLARLLTPYL